MLPLVIFTLLGLIIGATAIYGDSGWLIGAALGFLITKVVQMASKVSALERDIKVLYQLQQSTKKETAAKAEPTAVIQPQTRVSSDGTSTDDNAPTPLSESAVSAPIAAAIDESFELPDIDTVDIDRVDIDRVDIDTSAQTAAPASIAQANKNTSNNSSWVEAQAQQAAPKESYPIDKAIDFVRRFFTEGNPIVRVGMVVMFFGLSFLVKYAASEGMFPIELRMATVALVAIALIGLGWKTRMRAGGFGLVLQGGGVAALYLTIFAAAKLYSLMPTAAAFGLMLVVVLLGVALAVLQNAQVLALMATAGGFLAPILTSDGSGNHVALFSFYLLLNIGILVIAWFKTWRMLNWVGFVFTFVITSVWGVLKYEPHLYASTQPFLLAFFALYLIVSILFSLKQPPNLKGLVDGSLVFGLPIVGFGLQTSLLKHTEYGLAISAILLAALYILLARGLWAKYKHTHRVLIESFIALSLSFATLAIPLALDAQWTSATWALEGLGLIWVGLRQQRMLPRAAGYLLYMAAACSLLIKGINTGATPIISGDFIGMLLLSVSALMIAYLLERFATHATRIEKTPSYVVLMIGWCWWLVAGFNELNTHISGDYLFAGAILFFVASSLLMQWASIKLNWAALGTSGFWLLPLVGLWAARTAGEAMFIGYEFRPFAYWGGIALLAFAVVQYRFLWRQRNHTKAALVSAYHVITAWFLWSLVGMELNGWQEQMHWSETTDSMVWFAFLTLPVAALLWFTQKSHWPFGQYADYKNLIPAPLLLLSAVWFLKASYSAGATGQLYVPVLNPLDLAQAALVLLYAYCIKCNFVGLAKLTRQTSLGALGLIGFAWINIVLLRALHHYDGVAYAPDALWDSPTVQMALSILWAVCALVIMHISRRIQLRELWMVGAALLALIVLKLFTKDLSNSGTLAGIVSFLVVSCLMILIGYLSPIPAKTTTKGEGDINDADTDSIADATDKKIHQEESPQ